MAERDITEKVLEDYNDVFADIVNGLLFGGEQIVSEDELKNIKDKSQYKAEDGGMHEQERDTAKLWEKGEIRIAMLGTENQTDEDNDFPIRAIGYDGASYRSQMLGKKKERYPVVTIVLYFNTKRWKAPKSLHECFEIPEKLKPYVNDYKINLFEIAYLSDEQLQNFHSDFRIVADYFVQMRKNHDYQPSEEVIQHVDEVLKLMSVLTKDDRFTKVQSSKKSEGGGMTMCEVLDKVEARGEARGRAAAYSDMGLSVEEIAEKMGISEEEVEDILCISDSI